MAQKSGFLVPLPTCPPGRGSQGSLGWIGMFPTHRSWCWAGPKPPFPIPLFRVPPSAQTHSPSQSSSLHLAQLWNLTVQYKSNFEKSTVSARLFNSDYNGAKGCTCTGFLLPTERLCIRVRCLLPELLLCKSSPRGSPDLCKSNPGQESFCLYYSAPCRGMNYPTIPEARRRF